MVGTVAERFEGGGEEARPGLAQAASAAGDARHGVAANLLGVVAREEGAARGPAAAGVVELREAQSVRGEAVKIGGLNFAAVTSEIGVAEVVGHDEQDIGASGVGVRGWGQERQ